MVKKLFQENSVSTFKLSDLVGRNLDIISSGDNGIVVISAIEKKTAKIFVLSEKQYKDGEPCFHNGCLSHVSHACEVCGRIAGRKHQF